MSSNKNKYKGMALGVLSILFASQSAFANEYVMRTPVEQKFSSWDLADSLFSDWSKIGGHFDCGQYTPEPTLAIASAFLQSRDCSQKEERVETTREFDDFQGIYRVTGEQTHERTVVGSETRSVSVSSGSWSNSGGLYSCGGWSPSTGGVRKGTPFTQTRACKQGQVKTLTYSSEGSDIASLQDSREVNSSQSRGATGTRGHIWVHCSGENGRCYFNSGQARYVRYGAGGRYAYKWVGNGVSCSNGVFGDPYHGVSKACWYDQ